MAAATSASDTVHDEKLCWSGMDILSCDALGCRSRSASTVSEQSGANLSSEPRMRIAALKLPSSIFDMTAVANASSLADDLLAFAEMSCETGTMTSVTDRFLRTVVMLCFRPVLRGAVNIVELKLRKIVHASTDSGVVKILEMAEINSLAQCALAERGMCLIMEATGCNTVGDKPVWAPCDEATTGPRTISRLVGLTSDVGIAPRVLEACVVGGLQRPMGSFLEPGHGWLRGPCK